MTHLLSIFTDNGSPREVEMDRSDKQRFRCTDVILWLFGEQ